MGGSVSDVEAAVEAGVKVGSSAVIDELTIPNVHESVFPALGQSVVLQADEAGALGVVETFSGVSILAAADRAAKAARVTLFRIHVAMALGGKGLLLMTGSVSDVRAGVDAAADEARQRGLLVSEIVLPRPSKELVRGLSVGPAVGPFCRKGLLCADLPANPTLPDRSQPP